MANFPSLIPSEAPIAPGLWPTTPHKSLSGAEARIRHGSAPIGGRWSPSFVNITEADFLAILNHYRGQRSVFDSFGFSTTTLAADRTPAGFAWLYAGPPRIVDQHEDCFTVQCEFRCEPRAAATGPAVEWRTGATTFTVGGRSGGLSSGPSVSWITSLTTFIQGNNSGGVPQLYDAVDEKQIELNDSTGIESFTPLAGMPAGFIGSPGLAVTLKWSAAQNAWQWISYIAKNQGAQTTKTYTTAILTQSGVSDFTMHTGKLADMTAIEVSEPSWVRIYRSSAQRAADSRISPGGTLQAMIDLGSSKPYSENVTTTAGETIIQNPVPLLRGDSAGLVYVRLIKQNSGSSTVTLTITILLQEA